MCNVEKGIGGMSGGMGKQMGVERMFRHVVMGVGALLMVLLPEVAGAGEISELAAQAERKVQDDPVAALQDMNAALDKLWSRMPMVATQATFVAEPPKGFGLYKPRGNSTFKPGEPLIIYAEVAGFGHKPAGDGTYEIAINGDVAIATLQKQVLAKMPDFLKSRMRSHRRNKEFMVQMTVELSGAPAGQYVLLARLKDQVTGKTTSFSLPFRIAP